MAAGLFDEEEMSREYNRRVVMCVQFNQGAGAPMTPIVATLWMKKHPFFHDSLIYFPNAFDKGNLSEDDSCNGTQTRHVKFLGNMRTKSRIAGSILTITSLKSVI